MTECEDEIREAIARERREAAAEAAAWDRACPSDPDPYPYEPDDDEDDQRGTVLRQPTGRAAAEAAEADDWLLQRADRAAAIARIRARREVRRRNQDAARAARAQAEKTQTAANARARDITPRARSRRSPASRRNTVRQGTGGGGDGGDGDPEPPSPTHSDNQFSLEVFDYRRLAARWACNPRSLANRFSENPGSLPPHVSLPGTRGPRWLVEDIREFERRCRQIPDPPKRGRGRPRLAGRRP